MERRRLAAMKMYQSQEMVEDNVDDVKLGTIDAVSPRETIVMTPPSSKGLPSGVQQSQDLFGDNASVATTNVTTSSSATQRMGSNHKEFFGEGVFSPKNADGLASPVAQRRKERAMQRISVSRNSGKGNIDALPSPASPPPLNLTPKNKPTLKMKSASSVASSLRRNKTDEESVAASSVAASTAAASISEASGESKGSRSLFGKKKGKSAGGSVQGVSGKKKASIFGVANLIRKASVSSTAFVVLCDSLKVPWS
jgi:hypothetical protein